MADSQTTDADVSADETVPAGEADHTGEQELTAEQLRAKLEALEQDKKSWEDEREELLDQAERRERETKEVLGRQGQKLGEMERLVTGMLQGQQQPSQQRAALDLGQPADPVVDPAAFSDQWQKAVRAIQDLNERMEALKGSGGSSADIQALRDEIVGLKYQQFAEKEESRLRTEYGFNNRDMGRVRNFMQEAKIASAEAAAVLIPDLKEKMFNTVVSRRTGRDGQDKQKKASRGSPGKEMLTTAQNSTPPVGGSRRVSESTSWQQEMLQALHDGSWDSWPAEKKAEYEKKATQFAAQENKIF